MATACEVSVDGADFTDAILKCANFKESKGQEKATWRGATIAGETGLHGDAVRQAEA